MDLAGCGVIAMMKLRVPPAHAADHKKIIAGLLFFFSVFAVMLIASDNGPDGLLIDSIGHTLSYYTIVGNILLCLESALVLLGRAPSGRPIFHGCAIYSAILMFIVCLMTDIAKPDVNNFNPDLVIAHILNPFLAIALWWKTDKPIRYRMRDAFVLVSPPALWVIFVLLRGALVGEYPYFWIDPDVVGTACMYGNLFLLCGTAIFIAFAFVAFTQSRFLKNQSATVPGSRSLGSSKRIRTAMRYDRRDHDKRGVPRDRRRSANLAW